MSIFDRYIGIDYSGAKTPEDSLTGLRVFIAEGSNNIRNLEGEIKLLYGTTYQ